MKAEIFILTMLLLAGVSFAAPGDFPYPVYGQITDENSVGIRYLPIQLIAEDGTVFNTVTDTKGNYQFELSTAYSKQSVKIGIKGASSSFNEYILTGANLKADIQYSGSEVKGWLYGSGGALVLAAAGYWYYRKTNAGKKLKKCNECTDTHYCPK